MLVLLGVACGLASSPIAQVESQLISLCTASTKRDADIADCLSQLAADGGIVDPALSPLIEGEWALLHSTKTEFDARNPLGRRVDGSRPGLEQLFPGSAQEAEASSSPIQRAVDNAFMVTQSLRGLQLASGGRVEQLVSTPAGNLHLNAAASIDPATPRRVNFMFDEGYSLS